MRHRARLRQPRQALPGRRRDRGGGAEPPHRTARGPGTIAAFDVFLARHGETEWSRAGRHTGRTDLPLLPEGEERAHSLRPRLAAERFSAVFSSPLQRARRTADLAGYPDPSLDHDLAEWDYGDYEGITSAQIHEERPDWDLWTDGCPGGESIGDVRVRAGRFLERALAAEPGPVIAFSHGHLLRVVALVFLDLPDSAGARLNLDTAALCVLRRDGRGHQLQLWNDTGHLPGVPG